MFSHRRRGVRPAYTRLSPDTYPDIYEMYTRCVSVYVFVCVFMKTPCEIYFMLMSVMECSSGSDRSIIDERAREGEI